MITIAIQAYCWGVLCATALSYYYFQGSRGFYKSLPLNLLSWGSVIALVYLIRKDEKEEDERETNS